jgi:hypothetical protein
MGVFLVLLLGLVLVAFWVRQFVNLMSARDEDFPGRHDKVIWAAALLLTNLVGAAAFAVWARERTAAARLHERLRRVDRAGPGETGVQTAPHPPVA